MTGAIGAGRQYPAFSFSSLKPKPKPKPKSNTPVILRHSHCSLRPLSDAEYQPDVNYLTGLH